MKQELKIGNDIVILDSDVCYSGMSNPDEKEKLVRKAIGLPVKKQLVFFTDIHDASTNIIIDKYQLVEMYDITDRWYTVEVFLENGSSYKIHSDFLIEMQKPSFVADINSF